MFAALLLSASVFWLSPVTPSTLASAVSFAGKQGSCIKSHGERVTHLVQGLRRQSPHPNDAVGAAGDNQTVIEVCSRPHAGARVLQHCGLNPGVIPQAL